MGNTSFDQHYNDMTKSSNFISVISLHKIPRHFKFTKDIIHSPTTCKSLLKPAQTYIILDPLWSNIYKTLMPTGLVQLSLHTYQFQAITCTHFIRYQLLNDFEQVTLGLATDVRELRGKQVQEVARLNIGHFPKSRICFIYCNEINQLQEEF